MSLIEQIIEPLVSGDHLTWEEFIRRWEAMPEVKLAELIGGIVYMPSPITAGHGDMAGQLAGWLQVYAANTPVCRSGGETTWHMRNDAPQPDAHLRILEEFGGKAQLKGQYFHGAPELIVEVSLTTTSYDLFEKKSLYQSAGVDEYVVMLLPLREVRWSRLEGGVYRPVSASPEGVLRSSVFPGLWLNVPALVEGRMKEVLETLQHGLDSAEHEQFLERISKGPSEN